MASGGKGLLVIFSAPSGCGKDTILSELFKREECGDYMLSVSMTTRAPREDEIDGVSYFFVNRDEFVRAIENDELIEYAEYNGNYYGTPSGPVNSWLEQGKTVFLEIEVQGAEKVRKKRPDAVGIFILPPSIEELERRLRKRNTDSDEAIARRIALAPGEIAQSKYFDYRVVNDSVSRAADEIVDIINSIKEKMNDE